MIQTDAIGSDVGGGGISLSLVRGMAGPAFPSVTAERNADRSSAAAEPPTVAAVDEGTADALIGNGGSESSTAEAGHAAGGLSGAAQPGQQSLTGSGFDPGAFASMAPLSFNVASEPGFFEQVQRCLKTAPASALTFTVILNDKGEFVGAYPMPSGSLNTEGADPQITADAIEAVRSCGPYTGLPASISRPMTLVIPAGAQVAQAAPPAVAR